ncbi:hypothetical protein FPE01S_01_09750 [Flavihumibacter petaseus NBRC 106054]|uniref:Coenzyme Q-binding protein COQ10 START domain-containing protein n=2 Tax=Flavihumibacter TaxID=1004301 RepID=A0A0E9MW61_9BACT|nr:hypothetical protein FPE01S_01_09750 [Flavihumibacter petaseus NBRC 106054]
MDQAWSFFINPLNLARITPPGMRFEVLTDLTDDPIFPGQRIDYRLRPLFGWPVRWTTVISIVEAGSDPDGDSAYRHFVDEQERGPYRLWRHQHHFKAVAGGVEMTDIVDYQLPFGVVGDLAGGWLVRGQLKTIFTFRREAVERLLFPDAHPGAISASD